MSGQTKVRNYCYSCIAYTNHLVLHEVRRGVDPYDYPEEILYQIVRCCGCDNISFRKVAIDLNTEHENEFGEIEYQETIEVFPKFLKNHKPFNFLEFYELPKNVRKIYQDTLKSYANDSKILTGAGLRACIESVCNDLQITDKDLKARINKLNKDGFISKSSVRLLHGIRFMGNDSIHEIKEPSNDELDVALKIIEHLFENVYILPKIANGTLKTTIEDYTDFLNVLKQNLQNFNSGDEFSLYKLLGKDFRRCQSEISNFQQRLDSDINSGNFTLLKKGKVDNSSGKPIQHYVLT